MNLNYLLADISIIPDYIINSEFKYVLIVFLLFFVPRIFSRFGVPLAISAFAIGFIAQFSGFSELKDETALKTFSIIGISSLFLHAGLEVDILELKKNWRPLIEHVSIRLIQIVILYFTINFFFGYYPYVVILLAALVLLTPSTGFILDSLSNIKLNEQQAFWIRNKAIAAEFVALALLFLGTQSESVPKIITSSVLLILLILILPYVLGPIYHFLSRYAPHSEFGYIILIATVVGIITKKLGAYYLVGAFIVGLMASKLKSKSTPFNSEGIFLSVKNFASLFVPFYFFNAGLNVYTDMISLKSLLFGILFLVVLIPIRVFSVVFHRYLSLKENMKTSFPVAVALLPNLVFGLVLIEILEEVANVDPAILGGLLIYTIVVSILPGWFLNKFLTDSKLSELSKTQINI